MGSKGTAGKGKEVGRKGKAVAGTSSGGKRKGGDGDEKSGGKGRTRNNPGVLRFFDDVAADSDGSDSSESDFDNDLIRLEKIRQEKDIQEVAKQARRTQANQAAFAQIQEHESRSLETKSIESAQIISLGESSVQAETLEPPQEKEQNVEGIEEEEEEEEDTPRWTLDRSPTRTLPANRLAKITSLNNLFGVTVRQLGNVIPSEPPENSIILPTATLQAGLPIPLPRAVCQMLSNLNLTPGQLNPNAFRTMIATMALFKLKGLREINVERFRMLYQMKESHGSIGIYSFSSWAPCNIIIGLPESEKSWKEEMVVLEGPWFEPETREDELPRTHFDMVPGWSKTSLLNYDSDLIQELMTIAKLPACHRHWKVLMSSQAMSKCGFLKLIQCLEEVDPFLPENFDEAIRDLAVNNKRNRLIRDSFLKSICSVVDVIPGDEALKTMPNPEDVEKLGKPERVSKSKGTTHMGKVKKMSTKKQVMRDSSEEVIGISNVTTAGQASQISSTTPPRPRANPTTPILAPLISVVPAETVAPVQRNQPTPQNTEQAVKPEQEIEQITASESPPATEVIEIRNSNSTPPTRVKRRADIYTEDIHDWWAKRGVKTRKVMNPFLEEEETEQKAQVQASEAQNPVQATDVPFQSGAQGSGKVVEVPSQTSRHFPMRPTDCGQGSGSGQSPTQAGTSVRSAEPTATMAPLPQGHFLPSGYDWLEKSLREMVNVGLAHGQIRHLESIEPDKIQAYMALKNFELFYLSTWEAKLHNQLFGGPYSHQVNSLNQLNTRIRELEDELTQFKEAQTVTAQEKEALEVQLAKAESGLIALQAEKEKAERDAQTARIELQNEADRVKTLQHEQQALDDSVRHLSSQNKTLGITVADLTDRMIDQEREILEMKENVHKIEEQKVTAFEFGLLIARDHVDKTKIWNQIDWTNIQVPKNNEMSVPEYFRQSGKISDRVREKLKKDREASAAKAKEKS